MSVPDDVSVVGYDDSAFMTCTDPPLTTIRQPIEAMGQAVVALLVSEIAGNEVPADELLFEPELVVRGSTGAAPPSGLRHGPWTGLSSAGRAQPPQDVEQVGVVVRAQHREAPRALRPRPARRRRCAAGSAARPTGGAGAAEPAVP